MSTVLLDRAGILALVPHQGAMCLWDEVVEWDAQRIGLRARNHVAPTHPLRARGRLPALALCEYGAQAMAVHGGLLTREHGGRAAAGVLVALREVDLAVARIDDLAGALEGEAELLAAGPGSQQYAFRIRHRGRLLASGRAAAMLDATGLDTGG
ncbi:phosphotransferase [Pseudoxanthomonas broegbernensis]|uniref:Phosphotransferase n=1 Tax=Pseudoxanthomonas broegbernensis TaxID=83619 RepID=A0A7V8K6D2_9GAMM|nr:phosphotransferase [Pseudoxanthomonas broegbernensis]KAF1685719.1 phosphotransferase [Pseudoxanthomonas broegbernensis]MBB6066068.1 putative hotdog family 3-hydroxylacyl-ACP dehydratase [Pseudoxanthomonas broegbernensis]